MHLLHLKSGLEILPEMAYGKSLIDLPPPFQHNLINYIVAFFLHQTYSMDQS